MVTALDPLAHQRDGLHDDFCALGRRRFAPNLEACFGCVQRGVEIGAAGGGHGPKNALVGRIDDRLPGRALPLPTDIELQLRIVRHCASRRVRG
jgi:hypothetical protein